MPTALERTVSNSGINVRVESIALAAMILIAASIATPAAQSQTLSILHSFSNAGDGATPIAGLTIDQAGNFYGTTAGYNYGADEYGTVFKLSRVGTGWVVSTLYTFQGGDDGFNPYAGVVFGPAGALYGTTSDLGTTDRSGGSGGGGTIFSLQPPATPCRSIRCPWTKTVLHHFQGGSDGLNPGYGNLVFDTAGNIYGTTTYGGDSDDGTIYKLTRSGESWTESVLYSFTSSGNGGVFPEAGVVMDNAGNLYGTTFLGGADDGGAAYQLTPSGTFNVLHSFGSANDGDESFGGLVMDQQGNLYGGTFAGGAGNDGGTVYELLPSGGGWSYRLVISLSGAGGPASAPILDSAGNLYFTTVADGSDSDGNIFKLTPSRGTWIYTDLHDFNGRDGEYLYGSAVIDANGNIYGTTSNTSPSGFGDVWELTP